MSTLDTFKLSLSSSICLIYVMAMRTLSAAITRVNKDYCYPRLVDYQALQLRKCPSTLSGSVRSPYRCPVANVLEILKRDSLTGVFGALHQCFRDAVVDIFAKCRFFSSYFLEMTFGVLAAHVLQFSTQAMIFLSYLFNQFATGLIAERIHQQVDNANIHPDIFINLNAWGFNNIECCQQIETVINQDQISLTFLQIEALLLIITNYQSNLLPASDSPQSNIVTAIESHNARIVDNRPLRLEINELGFIMLVSITDFSNCANCQLGREMVRCFNLMVNDLLKINTC
jgi:hypothetical protein